MRMPMSVSGDVGKHAAALYKAASEANQVEQVHKEFTALLAKGPDAFLETIRSPEIEPTKLRKYVADATSKAGAGPVVSEFVGDVAKASMLRKISGIQQTYADIYFAHMGYTAFKVTTPRALSASEKKTLTDMLTSQHLAKGRKMLLQESVDPNILGGLKISYDDKLVDMSVQSLINRELSS